MRSSGRAGPSSSFEVKRRSVRGATVISLAGEVDLSAEPDVRAHLDEAAAGAEPRIVVDMSRVTFVDSSFLHSLIRTWRRAQRAGGGLAIVCVDPGLRRLLDVFGLAKEVSIFGEVGEAVAALAAG
jgi:anti-sigma B factor antagonist